MIPIINIGRFALQSKYLMILIGLVISVASLNLLGRKINKKTEKIENTVFYSFFIWIISARLGYVIQNFSFFFNNPLKIFSLSVSMLNIEFGFFCSIVAFFIFSQKLKLPIWDSLNLITPSIAAFLSFFFLGNFLDGRGIGIQSELWNGFFFDKLGYYPVQLIIAVLEFILLIALFSLSLSKMKKHSFYQENLFLCFVIINCVIAIFLQPFAGNNKIIFGRFFSLQLAYWILLLISLIILQKRRGDEKRNRSTL